MELKIKCSCGNIFRVNAGDSVQDGLYIWYASYFCDKCGQRMEVDGYDIDMPFLKQTFFYLFEYQ